MSTLWPRNRPLNQPSHYGRIGAQHEQAKPCPIATDATAVVKGAQYDRQAKTIKYGGKAVVRG